MLDLSWYQAIMAGSSTVGAALGGLSMLAASLAIWYTFAPQNSVARRLESVVRLRQEFSERARSTAPRQRRRPQRPKLISLLEKLRLAHESKLAEVGARLSVAGYRSRDAVHIYLAAKAGLPILVAGLAIVLVFWAQVLVLSDLQKVLVSVGAILVAFVAPDVLLVNAATRRRTAIQKGLPDALDLLVICAEAGLSLDAALERVARELAPSNEVLSEEIGITAVELTFLPERRQALQNLAKRTDLPAVRAVVSTLAQTEKYGTPLAQSLRVLSAEFREHRMLRAEEKAARLPAILTVPLIVFILPTLFVVLIGPAMLDVYDQLIAR